MPGSAYNFMGVIYMPGHASITSPRAVSLQGLEPAVYTNAFPGASFENTGASNSHRAYDRFAAVSYPASAVGAYAWQGEKFFGLTSGSDWSLLHTMSAMSSSLDYGLHTGLYTVSGKDGVGTYLCGFYYGTSGLGRFRFNLETGALASGLVTGQPGSGSGITFSTCCEWNGYLVTAYSGNIIFYDPVEDEIRVEPYSAAATAIGSAATQYDKVCVLRGNLYVVTGGNNLLAMLGISGLSRSISIGQTNVNYSTGGDFSLAPYDDSRVWIIASSDEGGGTNAGLRAGRVTELTYAPPRGGAGGLAVVEYTSTVIPGVLQYPTSNRAPTPLLERGEYSGAAYYAAADTASDPRAASYTWGRILGYAGYLGGSRFTAAGHRAVSWHYTSPFTYGLTGGVDNPTYSIPQTAYGSVESLIPEGHIQFVSAEPYKDNTVEGMLIKFRNWTTGPQSAVKFVYGIGISLQALPVATLSDGDGINIGGSAVFDSANNRITGCTLSDPGNQIYQIIWDYATDGVLDFEWVLLKAYGFVPGAEAVGFLTGSTIFQFMVRPFDGGSATPLQTSGLVEEITLATQATPLQVSSPVEEITLGTLATPIQTSSPVEEVVTLTNATPIQTSGPVEEILTQVSIYEQIANAVAFTHAVKANLIPGVGSNDIAFTDAVQVELDLLLSSDILFDDTVENNFIVDEASNDILFDGDLDNNIVLADADNDILFGQIVDIEIWYAAENDISFDSIAEHNFHLLEASNNIAFDSDAEHNFKIENPANDILFDPTVSIIYEFSLESNVAFNGLGEHNYIFNTRQSNINFDDEAIGSISPRNVSLENNIHFDQQGYPTTEESVSNTITFDVETSRMENSENSIGFTHSITAIVSKAVDNDIAFGQEVGINFLNRNLSVSNDILFGQAVLPFADVDACLLQEYNPQGAGMPAITFGVATEVTFVSGAYSLTVRNPEFGNSEELEVDRALNVSRGASVNIMRDPQWTKETRHTINFVVLTEAKANEVLTFLRNTLGLLVTYTDPDNRDWDGIITNPESAIVDGGGTCKYSVELQLASTLA